MLCDDLILLAQNLRREKVPEEEHAYVRGIAKLVGEAERFHLDYEAVDVVLDVQETKPSSLIAGLGICRLPYPKVWIEFDLKYRMDAMARYGYVPDYPADIKVLTRGVLLVAADESDGVRGTAYFVFKQNGKRPIANPISAGFDFSNPADNQSFMIRDHCGDVKSPSSIALDILCLKADDYSFRFKDQPVEIEGLAHMENIFLRQMHDLAAKWLEGCLKKHGQKRIDAMMEDFMSDFGGEPRFVLGLLMLLNSRNLATYEECSVRDKNRARGVRAGRAVVSHRTVKIMLSKVSQNRMAAQGMSAAEMAYCKVRGHWKVRKTGVFFWRPHARGSRVHGEIVHDYAVTA